MEFPNTALSRFKYFTFIILTLFLSLAFAFIGVAYIYEEYHNYNPPISNFPVVTRFDSELGWELKENLSIDFNDKNFSSNSLGIRSNDIDLSKEHILIIGDSIAYGILLDEKETISHLLQKQIPQLQTLNMGVEGYGLGQTYLRLEKYIGKTRPKFIVLIICAENDIQNTGSNYHAFNAREKPLFKLVNGKLKLFREKVPKYSCLNTFSRFWIFRKTILGSLKKICHVEEHSFNDTVKIIGALLNKIRDLGKQHGAKLVLAISPDRMSFKENFHPQKYYKKIISETGERKGKNKDYAYNVTNYMKSYRILNLRYKAFKNIALESNFNFVDLKHEFEKNKRTVNNFFLDNIHYNFEGNQFLADRIYKKVFG